MHWKDQQQILIKTRVTKCTDGISTQSWKEKSTQSFALVLLFPNSPFLKGKCTLKEMEKNQQKQIRNVHKVTQSIMGCISSGKQGCLSRALTFRKEVQVMKSSKSPKHIEYANLITSYFIIDTDILFVAPRGEFAFYSRRTIYRQYIKWSKTSKKKKVLAIVKHLHNELNTA